MSYGSTPPPPPPPPPPGGYPPPPAGGGYYQDPSITGFGQLAAWPQRALGYLVDVALYIPGYLIVMIGAAMNSGRGNSLLVLLGYLVIFGVAIWNRWLKGGQGQTLGRKVAGVTLLNAQGQPLGAGMAFVRDLCHMVDSLICYIGWLCPLWDAKRQTIADKILNTTVVVGPK